MTEVQEKIFNNWMHTLYQIALINIGEDRMLCESWYYTNRNIWEKAYLEGYTPQEAYEEDCTL